MLFVRRVLREATGEGLQVLAAKAAEQHVAELAAAIDMQYERPERPRLVIVVREAHHCSAAGELDILHMALVDTPGQGAETDAMGRSLERDSIDPAARTDRVAVARLEIRSGDTEAHGLADPRAAEA